MQTLGDNRERRWLLRPELRPQAEARLFCLPYAGSGAAAYRPWLAQLPTSVELNLVQLPGREARIREQAYRHIEPLIADLAPIIAGLLDRPYALFGHSMGALVAFELARALRRSGAPSPTCLFVSGRRAPQLPDRETPLHLLSDAQFVAEMAQRYNGIPQVILDDAELMQLFLPTLRADLALIETYTYAGEPPLACPIVAIGGQDDRRVSRADLLAWQLQTGAAFHMRQLPGGHFYLQARREELIEEISGSLARSFRSTV